MIAIDTNVMLRLLVRDHEEQVPAVERFISTRFSKEDPGYVSRVVIAETAWVLKVVYGYEPRQMGDPRGGRGRSHGAGAAQGPPLRPISHMASKSKAAAKHKSTATRGPAVASDHLVPEEELRRIAELVFKFSEADETEVSIDAATDALTRFANNTIHQNVAEQIRTVSVRTVFGGRTARASTNKLDEESVRRVVEASSRLARSQPPNPDLLYSGNVIEYGVPQAEADPARGGADTLQVSTGTKGAGFFQLGRGAATPSSECGVHPVTSTKR